MGWPARTAGHEYRCRNQGNATFELRPVAFGYDPGAMPGVTREPRHHRLDRRAGQAAALRRRGRQETAGRGRLSPGLRADAQLPERPLRQRRPDLDAGQFNIGGYCNPGLDALTRKTRSESDKAERNRLIAEAFKLHADDIGHLPLHQQSLAWGVSRKVELVQLADNAMFFK